MKKYKNKIIKTLEQIFNYFNQKKIKIKIYKIILFKNITKI